MNHLSPEQLVDLIEGRAEPSGAAHAAACAACGAAADELRETMAFAGLDGAPNPSPLFWDHFSARVGDAIRAEAGRRERRAAWLWRWMPASALAAAVVVAAVAVLPRDAARVPAGPAREGVASTVAGTALVDEDAPAAPDDASWMLMSELSLEMTADEARTALPAMPGTADRALRQLNDAERAALVEILREEMGRASAGIDSPAGD